MSISTAALLRLKRLAIGSETLGVPLGSPFPFRAKIPEQTKPHCTMAETFAVCQSQPDGTVKVLYQGLTLAVAETEADRLNSNLSAAGIPSTVSVAFVL